MKIIDARGTVVWDSEDPNAGPMPPPRAGGGQYLVASGGVAPKPKAQDKGAIDYFLGGTGIPDRLRALNQALNPVEAVGQSMQASQRMTAPGAGGWERVAAAGDMLSGVAGVVAPGVAASRAGTPTANAIAEILTGVSASPKGMAARDFAQDESGALRLFHGSPHDFDRFSMDKIGTGEGAQAYGHGLYFAEAEDTAKAYRDALSRGLDDTNQEVRIDGQTIQKPSTDQVRAARFGIDATASSIRRQIEAAQRKLETASDVDELGIGISDRDMVQMDIDALSTRLNEVLNLSGRVEMAPAGRMYEVEVNANPEDFLDWDAPLSQQPRKVQDAMQRAAFNVGNVNQQGPNRLFRPDDRGPAYLDLVKRPEAPAELYKHGIPGIRYLDAGSRGAGDGSRNYVVFDENLINIVRKYGIAGAAAMLGVGVMDVEQAMAQPQQNQLSRAFSPNAQGRNALSALSNK